MSDVLTKLSYQAFQQTKSIFGLTHRTLATQLRELMLPKVQNSTEVISNDLLLQLLQQRTNHLLETDWQNAEEGVYPTSLLFDNPWEDFFNFYPLVWLDLPQIWERIEKNKHQEFSPEINTDGYPSYYLQNFHYQSNGYLSDMSANLYDLQIELMYGGTFDIMRRRVLAPLKQCLKVFESVIPQQIRILDIGCGTGRTLKMIRAALPPALLHGVDLSSAYLRKANELLSPLPGEMPQLVQANAEELPYMDNYFHAVTSVYLLHELPAKVRQTVIEQCFRVIKPGGVFIICDSLQSDNFPEMVALFQHFLSESYEPYFKHYMNDNLVTRLEKAGFENIETQIHFVSKYLIARKPA